MPTPDNDVRNRNNDEAFNTFVQWYGRVKIKGFELFANNIALISIKEWIFDIAPRLDLQIIDNGIFFDKFPLEENDIIEVQLALTKEQEEPVRAKFRLQNYSVTNTSQGEMFGSIIAISAILDMDEMFFPIRTRSFKSLNSSEVIKKIASETKLETDLRINPIDTMTWLQLDMTNAHMLRHVVERSYLRNDDANFCYGTIDGKLTFTSLKKELTKKAKYDASFDPRNAIESTSNEETKDRRLNERKTRDPIYYNNYSFSSNAGVINQEIGYGATLSYYDVNSEETQYITMKSDYFPLTTNSFKTKSNIGKIVTQIEKGIKTLNTHDNWMRSEVQYKYIQQQFFTSYLMLRIKPITNLKLFDKIFVNIPQQDAMYINNVHSGEYIVAGITHQASSTGLYTMTLILCRNGMNAKEASVDDTQTRLNGE